MYPTQLNCCGWNVTILSSLSLHVTKGNKISSVICFFYICALKFISSEYIDIFIFMLLIQLPTFYSHGFLPIAFLPFPFTTTILNIQGSHIHFKVWHYKHIKIMLILQCINYTSKSIASLICWYNKRMIFILANSRK